MKKGFTLLEILIVIAIFLIMLTIAFSFPEKKESKDIVFQLLNEARINSLAGFQDSSWGVKVTEKKVVLFKGESYEERNINFDEEYHINSNQEGEFIFEKITGFTEPGEILDVYINKFGLISFTEKDGTARENIDSRRVLVYYDRIIDDNEKIILNDEEFLIKDYFKNDNISLKHEDLLIETLKFNNPNTVFFIKRDRRIHQDPLTIFLEGDQNYIIEYSQEGETNYQSLFVEKIKWE